MSTMQNNIEYTTHKAPKDEWNLTANEYVSHIKAGWNYGNGTEDPNFVSCYGTDFYKESKPASFNNCKYDGCPTDCFGKRITDPIEWERTMSISSQWPLTKQMLEKIHNSGFDALRLPSTWFNWSDYNSGEFTLDNGIVCTGDKINGDYLARIKEIVDWACELDMYVIINTHHDDSIWLHVDTYNSDNWQFTKTRFENYWKQISCFFKDYGSNVMFAGMNEIVWGETAATWDYTKSATTLQNCCKQMGELYQLFVDTVRASGGNNGKRYLCVSPMGAICGRVGEMILPHDESSFGGVNRIVIEAHEYYAFYHFNAASRWDEIFTEVQTLKEKGYGYIIGEGAFTDAVTDSDNFLRSREAFEMYTAARAYGVPIFQWDNGGIGGTKSSMYRFSHGEQGLVVKDQVWSMFNRSNSTWRYPNQIESIMNAVYCDEITSTVGQSEYYYWKDDEYCKTVLDKGLLTGNRWRIGAYNGHGGLVLSCNAIYTDTVKISSGKKYELRLNSYFGGKSGYFFTVYGIKPDGSAVPLGTATRAKSLCCILENTADENEGQAVDISRPFNCDVKLTAPDDVTALAISIVGKGSITPFQLLCAVENTAINPSLTVCDK